VCIGANAAVIGLVDCAQMPKKCASDVCKYCRAHECGTTTTTTTSSARKDPHLLFADGGKADFKGQNNTVYNLLSARNLSVNALFMYDDFVLPRRVIHGSYMSALYARVKVYCNGCKGWGSKSSRVFTVEYNTSGVAKVGEIGTSNKWKLKADAPPLRFGNAVFSMVKKHALEITDGRWITSVVDKEFPNPAGNPGKKLLHVKIMPAPGYDVDGDATAPHGLIGQSYDGDSVGISGSEDNYRSAAGEFTTKAQAEGAIEGSAADYVIKEGPFSQAFKYSRFDLSSAPRRDVSRLMGRKVAGKKVPVAAAVSDAGPISEDSEVRATVALASA